MNCHYPIGATAMLEVQPNLFLKIEYTNLTGSVKDRAALEMILDGEKSGKLQPGGTIIEPTSGNTGISLAALARDRGYSCIILMPDSMSVERQQLMISHGAKVVLTPGALGMSGAVAAARELLQQIPHSWMPDQFANPSNPKAHYRTTGPEIWEQTKGSVDIFVAGVGTGGTITGVGRYLKEKNPDVRIVAVEPESSPLLSTGRAGKHGIQGIGPNFVPDVLQLSLLDAIYSVTDADAISAARELAERGIPCGISAGAAYHAARRLWQENPGKRIVTILPDGAERYSSMGLLEIK
jgi:cysteine synthase A